MARVTVDPNFGRMAMAAVMMAEPVTLALPMPVLAGTNPPKIPRLSKKASRTRLSSSYHSNSLSM